MIEIISDHDPTNADRIRSLNDEELAQENVVGFAYMRGHTPSVIWRSVHTGDTIPKKKPSKLN